MTNIYPLDWIKHQEMIQQLNIPIIEVDGSVNSNPGHFGITGLYNTREQNIMAHKYKGQRLTNQLLEMLAIYHGLEHYQAKYETESCLIVSDSLTIINTLADLYKVKNPRLMQLKDCVNMLLDNYSNIYLVYRRGHTKLDHVGRYISYLVKFYNKTQIEPHIENGSLQSLITELQW